jgi:hypothetical protein
MPAVTRPGVLPSDMVAGPPEPRCCGRCRQWFPGEAAAPVGPLIEWWLCTACAHTLLGVALPT